MKRPQQKIKIAQNKFFNYKYPPKKESLVGLPINSLMPAFVRAANILLQSRAPVISLLHRYIQFTAENGNPSENPPSLANRVSTNLRDTVLWVAIACQVAIVIRNILFETILIIAASSFILMTLVWGRSFAHSNDKLQADGQRKDHTIDQLTINDTSQKETLSKIKTQLEESQATNDDLKATNNGLKKTSEGFEQQLQESQMQLEALKSAAAGLVNSIATIDKAQELFQSAADQREENLTIQIEQLKIATQFFISAIKGKQDTWDGCIEKISEFRTQIASASATLAERQAQIEQVTKRLEELQISLSEAVQGHRNQLNETTFRLRESAQQVHEATSTLNTPSRNKPRRPQFPSTPETPSTPNSQLPSGTSSA